MRHFLALVFLALLSPIGVLACRPAGAPCLFASSSCDGDSVMVSCESTGGGAGSGKIKRTPCGDGARCLEQRAPAGTIGGACETLAQEGPCDPKKYASRCDGKTAIVCDTFVSGSFAVKRACVEGEACVTDAAGKASCQFLSSGG